MQPLSIASVAINRSDVAIRIWSIVVSIRAQTIRIGAWGIVAAAVSIDLWFSHTITFVESVVSVASIAINRAGIPIRIWGMVVSIR